MEVDWRKEGRAEANSLTVPSHRHPLHELSVSLYRALTFRFRDVILMITPPGMHIEKARVSASVSRIRWMEVTVRQDECRIMSAGPRLSRPFSFFLPWFTVFFHFGSLYSFSVVHFSSRLLRQRFLYRPLHVGELRCIALSVRSAATRSNFPIKHFGQSNSAVDISCWEIVYELPSRLRRVDVCRGRKLSTQKLCSSFSREGEGEGVGLGKINQTICNSLYNALILYTIPECLAKASCIYQFFYSAPFKLPQISRSPIM